MPRKMRSLERAAVKSLTLLRSFLPAPPTPLAMSLVSLGSEVSRFRWRNRAGVGEGFQTPAPDCGGGPSGSPARVLGGCSDSGRKWLDLAQVTAGRGRGPRGSLALLSLLCVGCGLFFLSCQPTDRDKGWTNNHINKVTRAERGAVGEEDATPFCSDSSVVLVSLLKSSPTLRRIPEAPASSSGLWRAFFNAGPTLRRPFACAVLPPGAPFLQVSSLLSPSPPSSLCSNTASSERAFWTIFPQLPNPLYPIVSVPTTLTMCKHNGKRVCVHFIHCQDLRA